jgi:hypothetical protein
MSMTQWAGYHMIGSKGEGSEYFIAGKALLVMWLLKKCLFITVIEETAQTRQLILLTAH